MPRRISPSILLTVLVGAVLSAVAAVHDQGNSVSDRFGLRWVERLQTRLEQV